MDNYGKQNFYTATSFDGEVYLNPGKGFWSIVRPLNREMTNYVFNPSFEGGNRDFWHNDLNTNNANLSIVNTSAGDDSAYGGNYALLVVGVNTHATYGVQYSPLNWGDPAESVIPIKANGGRVYISAKVLATAGSKIEITAAPDGVISGDQPGLFVQRTGTCTAVGDWQTVKAWIVNQRSGDAFVQIRITVTPASGNFVPGFLVDEVMASDADLDYFDGDTEDAYWAGAPYASQSKISKFTRWFGEEIFLADLGFNLISYTGHGMPPMSNDTIPYAQGGGAYYNRSWPEIRALTLVGQIEAKQGIRDYQRIHSRLLELVGLHRFYVDPQPFILRYRLTRDERDTTGVIEIPVVYKAGLEGAVTSLFGERITLQLEAYEDVFWRSLRTKTVTLPNDTTTTICYAGTAPTPMRVMVEGQTSGIFNVDLVSLRNLSLESGIYFSSGPSTSYQSVTSGQRLIVGSTEKICGAAYLLTVATGVQTSVAGHIARPQSAPSEFVLLNGNNDLRPAAGIYPGITPRIYVTYRERFLSASDAWRVPRDRSDPGLRTEIIDKFRRVC